MDKMKEIYDAFFQKTPQITKKALMVSCVLMTEKECKE